ncbi:tRNA (adenosine(37)-N6)-threonylcarbamoyltransferase complex ATPase subunit type 1 TsaE [Candidatus Solincola sp.]|nr:tRNA (adenosine(37)-N6)-threonylcarbamoyltransferase complex ATPase subunit type 1 TsaE [Actinomycetota bacterium]MDI7252166.1 tRNA (adenosine(37)-N6)-threonylcarbamoyltransferase complex ATPase subunit type 1 TsaE [Actinomycetota bacterium]
MATERDSGTGGLLPAFQTRGEGETRKLASRLAELLQPGDVILLVGELGTGKTSFVRGLAEGLGVGERVVSPTFTLLREYRGRLPLHHLDAYRLEGASDLLDLGVEELLGGEGVVAVEWGDRVREFFRDEYLEVDLSYGEEENERVVRLVPRGGTWGERLKGLEKIPDGK